MEPISQSTWRKKGRGWRTLFLPFAFRGIAVLFCLLMQWQKFDSGRIVLMLSQPEPSAGTISAAAFNTSQEENRTVAPPAVLGEEIFNTSTVKQPKHQQEKNSWKIAAIIPSCDRPHSLQDAISSALNQSYPIHQVLVALDSGPGCLPAARFINLWNDNRVQFLQIPPEIPRGSAQARRFAMDHASSDVTHYALLDDDDEWFPEKTQVQVDQMQAQNYSFSSSDAAFPLPRGSHRCGPGGLWTPHNLTHRPGGFGVWNGGRWKRVLRRKFKLKPKADLPSHITYETLRTHNLFVTSSVLVAKEIYLGSDQIDTERNQDLRLWLRILQKGTPGLWLKDPLIVYDNARNACDDPSTSALIRKTT